MKSKSQIFIALFILHFSFYIFHSSIAKTIEVGGHITEDTTWSPDNNPYQVTSNIFIDEDVTLFIEPGTDVQLSDASLTSYDDWLDNFRLDIYDYSVAKMIYVNGRIIAEGTEEDTIRFSKISNEEENYWGTIYIPLENQETTSIFTHCKFEEAALIQIAVGNQAYGAIHVQNGKMIIENCFFRNNVANIRIGGWEDNTSLIVKNTKFYDQSYDDDIYATTLGAAIIISIPNSQTKAIFSGNYFYNQPHEYDWYSSVHISNTVAFNNEFININGVYANNKCYFQNNTCYNIVSGYHSGEGEHYIKDNTFIGGTQSMASAIAIELNDSYAEISNNSFNECTIKVYDNTNESKVFNNVLNQANYTALTGNISEYSNNIISNCETVIDGVGLESFNNNILINNDYAFKFLSNYHIISNSILIGNNEIVDNHIQNNQHPVFRNCILDFELPEECIDGGGNIWVDSLQAQQIFEDIENGDFHLTPGSIAIDAGFDTTGYYSPFDLDNNYRIWDGDNDGNAVIDIGPYEFGAPPMPKLCGRITEITSGEPVDYALIIFNEESGNFVVADSSGYFEIQLPPGYYDLYAERVFYEDEIVGGVHVEGDLTYIEFEMECTLDPVGTEEDLIIDPDMSGGFTISNYPNPFNPTTSIFFDIPADSKVNVSVFNLKGQRVATLTNEYFTAGSHSVVWNGNDDKGNRVSSGVYLYKVKTDTHTAVKKMILLK